MRKMRATLLVGTMLLSLGTAFGARAQTNSLTSPAVPPYPTPAQMEQNLPTLGNPINSPITGSSEDPLVVGTEAPPSLEALQDARPGDQPKDGLSASRQGTLQTAALTYGAQGGLAARSFALNEMLRRYEAQLDTTYDFGALVLPVNGGQTLMRPPIVSAAQMAFALGDNGQVARETSCIYEITREAQLASTAPNWRTYLVRSWATPMRPTDSSLPRTKQEVAYWDKWVAEGWADGETQADEIFLSDLGRLQRDMVGMARYRVLLRSNLVEQPVLAFKTQTADGGRDSLHINDQVIRITNQPGLQGSPGHWTPGAGCPQ
jgi:defect-in-organelle-trafficking protein DotC